MVVLDINVDQVKSQFQWKTEVSYSFVEKIVLMNFLQKSLAHSLNTEWFSDQDIEDYINAYISSMDKNQLTNI